MSETVIRGVHGCHIFINVSGHGDRSEGRTFVVPLTSLPSYGSAILLFRSASDFYSSGSFLVPVL